MSFLVHAARRDRAWRVNLGWGVVFGGFSLLQASNIPFFFYFPVDVYTQNAQIIGGLGILFVITIIGQFEFFYQQFHKTRYVISMIGLGIGITYFIVPGSIGDALFAIYFLVLAVFVFSLFARLIRLATGRVRVNLIIFFIAFCTLMFGNFLNNQGLIAIVTNQGIDPMPFQISGRVIKLISFIALFGVLQQLPIFMEVNWQQNIVQLFIIHKTSGLSIFHQKFATSEVQDEAGKRDDNDALVAGGFIGITTLLKEISQSTETLKLFDHGDVKILCEYGESLLIILYAKEEMHIYWDKLAHLRVAIEELFGETLKSWAGGDLGYFDPLKVLVKNEFQQ